MVHVTLHSVSGAVLELEVEPEASVADLKALVAEQRPWPAICQKLVLGARFLNDNDAVGAYCEDGVDSLTILLVMSFDALYSRLMDGDEDIRLASLDTLCCCVNSEAGSAMVDVVVRCLENDSKLVREKALETLVKITAKDDRYAIQAVMNLLDSASWTVRLAGLDALGRLAAIGDAEVMERILLIFCTGDIPHTQAELSEVKDKAISALVQIAGRQGSLAERNSVVLRGLEHGDFQVRGLAIESLGHLGKRGDRAMIDIIARSLTDESYEVVGAAISALARLGKKGDAHVIGLICAVIEQDLVLPDWILSLAAAALASLATNSEPIAVNEVARRLTHANFFIRINAVETLRHLDAHLKASMYGILAGRLTTAGCKHPAVTILHQNAEALLNPEGLRLVMLCLKDSHWMVRRAAVHAVMLMSNESDTMAADAVEHCLLLAVASDEQHAEEWATRVLSNRRALRSRGLRPSNPYDVFGNSSALFWNALWHFLCRRNSGAFVALLSQAWHVFVLRFVRARQ